VQQRICASVDAEPRELASDGLRHTGERVRVRGRFTGTPQLGFRGVERFRSPDWSLGHG
jgi:hypothetical protein